MPTTHPIQRLPLRALAALTGLAVLLAACAQNTPAEQTRTPIARGGIPTPEQVNDTPATTRNTVTRTRSSSVALLIEGEPITWQTLRPLLAEAAGSEITEEIALEHALKRRLRARGITIGQPEIDAARETWLALLEDAGLSVSAETEIRRRRGLGPERFRRLLWRNAALRALIDPDDTAVADNEVALARAIRTGRRYLTTGVVAPDAPTALRIRDRAKENPASGLWTAAARLDLAPFHALISPLDPAYPESIRRALPALDPDTPSTAIALDEGYAILIAHAAIPALPEGSGPSDAELRRELTIRKTRLAMERLARDLLATTEINRLDPSLDN